MGSNYQKFKGYQGMLKEKSVFIKRCFSNVMVYRYTNQKNLPFVDIKIKGLN